MKNFAIAVFTLGCLFLCASCGGGASTPPPVSLAVTSSAPPDGAAGLPYDAAGFAFSATGGTSPYHWSWVAYTHSSIPAGLNLSDTGLIAGTPLATGTFEVVVTVKDSGIPAAQTSKRYLINIAGAPLLTITSGNPPDGTAGLQYGPSTTEQLSCTWSPVLGWHLVCTPCSTTVSCSGLPPCGVMSARRCRETKTVFLGFTFAAGGGVSPYTWSATGLPPDLAIDPGTGHVTGTPSTAGTYSVTVTVQDSQTTPAVASANYTINVATPAP